MRRSPLAARGDGSVTADGDFRTATIVSELRASRFLAEDPDVLDSTLAGLGATVTRRAAGDVYAELQAAHEAENTASEEARRVLREQRREEREDQWKRFKETVGSKLP
jgi:hypothetical protein